LLTPDEVLRLPYEDALLLVAGMPPYRARKLMYFLDHRFRGRAGLPAPDSERQRRSELLPKRPSSDWEGRALLPERPVAIEDSEPVGLSEATAVAPPVVPLPLVGPSSPTATQADSVRSGVTRPWHVVNKVDPASSHRPDQAESSSSEGDNEREPLPV